MTAVISPLTRPAIKMVRRLRRGSRRVAVFTAVTVVAALAALIGAFALVSRDDDPRSRSMFVTVTPEPGGRADSTPVRLDTTLFLPESTPAPAVLLSQGFGGDKDDLAGQARALAGRGFVVLTYTARGFGRSGGKIHFASPRYEVNDAKMLVTKLAGMSEVEKRDGRAQVAAAGSSYGGGLSLLIAGYDQRVRAVSADITWNNLQHAFFPNAAGGAPGPFKKLWVGQLFANAFGERGGNPSAASRGGNVESQRVDGTVSCGQFAADVCSAYRASAAAGTPTLAMARLMRDASPASVIDRITAPTQLTQGVQDSLFPLSEADLNARGIAATGTPVSVAWRAGGHDDSAGGTDEAITKAADWFDKVFDGDNLAGVQPFTFSETDGVSSASTGETERATLRANGYPGIAGTTRNGRTVTLTGAGQRVASPAGGTPAVITGIPGLSGLAGQLSPAVLPTAPRQTALFDSNTVGTPFTIAGTPTVTLTVTTHTSSDATLFLGLRDMTTDGSSTLPAQLVSPLRLTGLTPGRPRTVTARLPAVVQQVPVGHRLVLSVSSSDFAYAGPSDAREYTISLPSTRTAVTIPTIDGRLISGGTTLTWLLSGLGACLLAALLVWYTLRRRRRTLRPDPELTDIPVSVRGLVKEYAGGYRAVDDISFTVEKGQVVGLLGPNGAGKTTALRVLVGLITPTEGELHVFGEPVRPGAPVLSRLGSFIEGPGFLPHLSGRENLRLYWAATGRPGTEAEFDIALDIAGLGDSIDRKVRTYSQGMRQRLGIAQAMLGLPELLILDEPTNGLDPPQIAEMREVMKQYAETGRTVVVSSHLLAEVEQTCTHVVVMHKGRVVSAGSVDEISGSEGSQISVDDAERAAEVLATAGIDAHLVPARRSLEDVFLELIDDERIST